MEAISRTKRLLPQKRKNHKIREPLVLKGSLEIICDSSIKLRWLRKTLYFFGVICSLAFFVMLVYLGAIEVIDEIELNVSSESLDIPVWLYTIATPLFSALIIVRILQRTVEDIQKQNF